MQAISTASATDTTPTKEVTATCPAGATLISGGYHWMPESPLIIPVASEPNGQNGWHVVATQTNGAVGPGAWTLTVFALCNIPPAAPK